MKRPFLTALYLPSLCLTAPMSAVAAPAHNHGEGQLAIVLEGETLTIELVADLMDLVGFEHAPKTKAQRAAITALHTRFETGAPLFALSSQAGCALQTAATEGGFKAQSDPVEDDHADHEDDEHDHDDHKDHDHDDHGDDEHGDHDHHDDHDGHDDHKDEHAEHGHEKSGHDGHDHAEHDHSDDKDYLVTARWSWTCDKPQSLRQVETSVFDEYPAVERLETVVLTDTEQAGAVLTSRKVSVELP